jgi:hypothetical protein
MTGIEKVFPSESNALIASPLMFLCSKPSKIRNLPSREAQEVEEELTIAAVSTITPP